jgi:regulator of replication initiation timing
METNELFDKIVKLEETSESLTLESLQEAEKIKNKAKEDLEILKESFKLERNQLVIQLEKQKQEEESLLKNKYKGDFDSFSEQLSKKFSVGFEKIVKLFKEQNSL